MARRAKIAGASLLLAVAVSGCAADPTPDAPNPAPPAAASGAPAGPKAEQVGKPFAFQETFTDSSDVVDWTVTVDALKCGLPSFENIGAQAPDGKAFCRVDASFTNNSDEPALNPDEFGKLETDQGEFEPDENLANQLMLAEDVQSIGPFKRGATAKLITVYAVPADAKPAAVRYPGVIWNNGPEYRITAG